MTPSTTVVVLDRTDALVKSLARAMDRLDEEPDVQVFDHHSEVTVMLADHPVDVLIVGPSEATAAGMRRVATWHRDYPATVVVVASRPDSLPPSAMLVKAGATQLLRLPAGPVTVGKALAAAIAESRARQVEVEVEAPQVELDFDDGDLLDLDEADVDVAADTEVELPEPIEVPAPRAPANVITVASATGGCGKTFLAMNLAYLLAAGTKQRVAMVDLDLQFGEVVAALQLRPQRTIADVEFDDEGRPLVAEAMTKHVGGFDVLAAPRDPIAAESLTPDRVSAIVEGVRELYDFVIIDTPPSLNEVVLSAMETSESLVVLATLDVPSVKNMRVFLTTLERLHIPTDGMHLVLNKAERGVGFSGPDVEQVLGRTWDLTLPYDKEVSRAINLGLPVTESAPHAEVSRRIIAGMSALLPGVQMEFAAAPVRRRGLARLLGMFRAETSARTREGTS